MTLAAGQHPAPLAQVHADLGPEGLRRHLAEDHKRPVRTGIGAARHQAIHRALHDEEK